MKVNVAQVKWSWKTWPMDSWQSSFETDHRAHVECVKCGLYWRSNGKLFIGFKEREWLA